MKKKKIVTAIVALLMVSSIALTGCSKKDEPASDNTTGQTTTDDAGKTADIDADQTINVPGYDFTSLDPSKDSDAESFTTLTNVYEGLMTEVLKDGKAETVLAGATDMKVSDDKKVYTFTLRDEKWSDGKPVTASDYVFSWRRLADPATAADYMTFLGELGVVNGEEVAAGTKKPEELGVKAIDDKTFEVTLAQPNPYFEKAMGFKCLVPQREDLAKAQGDSYGTDFSKMVFNGPFVISDYQKGAKIVYTKNDKYWDASNVKLQTANAFIINEEATLVKMFQNKELDMTGATKDNLKMLKAKAQNGEYQLYQAADASVFYYIYNTKSKVLSNAKVRKALSLAYDKQQQIDTVWQRFVPAYGLVPDGIAVGDKIYRQESPEPLKDVKDDPKALLKEGLSELGISDASKVKLVLLLGPTTSTGQAQSQYLQNQLKNNLGLNLEIKFSVDGPTYFSDRSKGNFDICAGGWGADYNDASSYFGVFLTGGGNNGGKYSNPEYDKLVKQAAIEQDSAQRIELYKQAEKLLLVDDAAVSPYFYKDVNSFRQNWLKGVYVTKFAGYYDLKGAYVQGKQ